MAGRLAGKRILVLEDEYFIASDVARALQKEEAVVIGPTGSLDDGLALLAGTVLDAAVLDVNLEGSMSFAIADVLDARSVPYMFITGYDGWALPEAYRAATRMAKPFSFGALVTCVERLVDGAAR